jgi:hypothetical protein
MTERREVPNFDAVSDNPKTGDRVHFSNCVWTLVVTGGRVTVQEVSPDKLSYALGEFRERMAEILGCIIKIELASRA